MRQRVRHRFWIELGGMIVTAGLTLLTLVSGEWIEFLFRVDPDQGSGALEWSMVLVALVTTVTLAFFARYEWRAAALYRADR